MQELISEAKEAPSTREWSSPMRFGHRTHKISTQCPSSQSITEGGPACLSDGVGLGHDVAQHRLGSCRQRVTRLEKRSCCADRIQISALPRRRARHRTIHSLSSLWAIVLIQSCHLEVGDMRDKKDGCWLLWNAAMECRKVGDGPTWSYYVDLHCTGTWQESTHLRMTCFGLSSAEVSSSKL